MNTIRKPDPEWMALVAAAKKLRTETLKEDLRIRQRILNNASKADHQSAWADELRRLNRVALHVINTRTGGKE